jgi:hypothetical protein
VTGDLWSAVDLLTKPHRQRLERDNGSTEWVEIGSLLDQLTEAVQSGSGESGRGVQGSRPPLDVACVSLLIDIAEAVREACRGFDIKRQFDTAKDLRRLASRLVAEQDNDDEIDWWVDALHGWCRHIRSAISIDPDRSWRLHGVPCPDCRTMHILENDDGQAVRRPAIHVIWASGLVRAIQCQACEATWYRGTSLDALVGQIEQQRLQQRAS